MRRWWCYYWLFAILLNVITRTHQYRTYSVERECFGKKLDVHLSSGDVTSAALIRATEHTSYSMAVDCTISLYAPDDHYIAVAVRQIEFRLKADARCQDYLRIKDESMCKPMRHLDEEHHFFSDGNTMHLLYHVAAEGIDNSTLTGYAGFQVTVTAYRRGCPTDDAEKSDKWFHCENGHCVWSGLKCDSHNNCGDLSDEENCPSGGGSGSTALIVLGVLILLLMIIMCIATLVCSKNENIRRIRTRTMSYLRRFSK